MGCKAVCRIRHKYTYFWNEALLSTSHPTQMLRTKNDGDGMEERLYLSFLIGSRIIEAFDDTTAF